MNCCDANGNCNQGRNCPVRIARHVEDEHIAFEKSTFVLVMTALEVLCVVLFVIGVMILWAFI